MNCLYTIPLCNFGFAFRHATCVIVKDFGKALSKTKSSPIFFSYKLSERKPLFEIAHCIQHSQYQAYNVTMARPSKVVSVCIRVKIANGEFKLLTCKYYAS